VSDEDYDDYSGIADAQLAALAAGDDLRLYDAVLDACELIFIAPDKAQSVSSAITIKEGIRFRMPVAGHPPYKVFWSSELPRIEAIFAHP
jgi:hypothetical protein